VETVPAPYEATNTFLGDIAKAEVTLLETQRLPGRLLQFVVKALRNGSAVLRIQSELVSPVKDKGITEC
jgi:hypothetical protein